MALREPNPYEPPLEPVQPQVGERDQRSGVLTSLLMIVVGAFFCVTSFYVILGHGWEALLSCYPTLGRFPVAYMVSYGFAGALTTLFHLSYLIRGWPQQHLAGLYAIVLAIGLACLAIALLEFIALPAPTTSSSAYRFDVDWLTLAP